MRGANTFEFSPRRLPPIESFGRAGDAGATAHYADPAYYARAYRRRRRDVDFYLELGRSTRGPVLEYGTGNGRVALPLARAGVVITGVDRSRPMLRDFERRLEHEPPAVRRRVRLVRADMRAHRSSRRYALVIAPFNTLLHLYTRRDLERFLAAVRRHLATGGRFVFDCSMPRPEELCGRVRAARPRRLWHAGRRAWVDYSESFEYDPERQLLLIWLRFEPRGEEPTARRAFAVPLTHRQFFPRELESELHYAGFRDIRIGVNFGEAPDGRAPETLLVECR